MRYDQRIIDDVRSANNIVEVIGEYLPLKRSGANYKCRCPFHNEKTPSFMVSPSKQIFKCFGCGKGGNVFTFLMEYEKINFNEAVQKLAQRAGIKLPQKEISAEKQTLYNELYEIYKIANQYYRDNLLKAGKLALEYLHSRQISDETIKTFQIGLASDRWDDLSNYLKKKHFGQKSFSKSGLFTERQGKVYDKFYSRIMFPIFSSDGKVIAFGGRIYKEEDDRGAKYLNSPENLIYKKRYHLYGLFQTKHFITQKKSALLVEGNTDLLKVYQYGFSNVVASLGTALTENQIKLLARYTKNVYILYDGDEAGYKASARAIKVCLENSLFPKIIMLPENYDPDSFLDEFGAEKLQEEIDKALSFYQFIKVYKNADKSLENKEDAIDELIDNLMLIQDPVQREMYIQEGSALFRISETNIVKSINRRLTKSFKRYASLKANPQVGGLGEKELLKMVVKFPEECADAVPFLEQEYFTHPIFKKLVSIIKKQDNLIQFTAQSSKLLDYFAPDEVDFVSDIMFFDGEFSKTVLHKLLNGLQIRKLSLDLQKINQEIIEHPDNFEKLREKKVIQKKIHQLKGGVVRKLLS
ncbi:MAG: DNA primase [Candidatus Cloacimonadota bacterium]|nr:DNA primase [Candidatus Cloacimonadota bacterium]